MIEISYLLDFTTFAYLISAIFITFEHKARKEIKNEEFPIKN
jgi:hypothetical protein